ncbi:rhodanese-related sulfurtransferase [Lewinella aquimaris]|uniref:Rhodanese-related sulfurtransferase n=1 Tax=Neolewinella aquimaris TaxID=1835722 RepID=A0A840EDE8_9BACT|nr:rhodanese-like domain-containing protein [Neolewinella aquimaris]MBB4079829.1 rhodanese-related sulfurtransferase [Neolewinella aquimaris]
MTVQRFHDETIDQYSYLIVEGGEAISVDPNRNVGPYIEYLEDNKLKLRAIILTHRAGSFASGWAELRQLSGADVVGASTYGFHGEGQYRKAGRATMIEFGNGCHVMTQLTPGYTADSISLVAMDAKGDTQGIFTGATLLNEGTGYPLPRPEDMNPLHNKRTYAKEMYASITNIIKGFAPRATVYAGFGEDAHFSKMGSSTHGQFNLTEAQSENPLFQHKTADLFADWLLEDYPFVPAYVAGCQAKNPEGYPVWAQALAPFRELLAPEHQEAIKLNQPIVNSQGGAVILTPEDAADGKHIAPASAPVALPLGTDELIIDTRPAADFRAGHPRNAINVQAEGPFALWLGSIVRPGEDFYVLVDNSEHAYNVAQSIAKIGYDAQVRGAVLWAGGLAAETEEPLDMADFKKGHVGRYTIVDVRPPKAAMEDTRFYGAINVPVWKLRDRWQEIPRDRPIVVHCGGGYQSAIGASLLRKFLDDGVKVYDLGAKVKDFKAKR